jgi:hypothetical protein
MFARTVLFDVIRYVPAPPLPFLAVTAVWGLSFSFGVVFCFSTLVERWICGINLKKWSRITVLGSLGYASMGWLALCFLLIPMLNELGCRLPGTNGTNVDPMAQAATRGLIALTGVGFGAVTGTPLAFSQWLALRSHSPHALRLSLVVLGSNMLFFGGLFLFGLVNFIVYGSLSPVLTHDHFTLFGSLFHSLWPW